VRQGLLLRAGVLSLDYPRPIENPPAEGGAYRETRDRQRVKVWSLGQTNLVRVYGILPIFK
jgi:hypothetical protein